MMGVVQGQQTSHHDWFTIRRHQRAGRILDCVVLTERPVTDELLGEGIVELVSCVQDIADAQRCAEHAGAAVIFRLSEEPTAVLALAAVRGFVLSAAQELGDRLKLNLVVHRESWEELEPTLDYLADSLSGYVQAATLALGDLQA